MTGLTLHLWDRAKYERVHNSQEEQLYFANAMKGIWWHSYVHKMIIWYSTGLAENVTMLTISSGSHFCRNICILCPGRNSGFLKSREASTSYLESVKWNFLLIVFSGSSIKVSGDINYIILKRLAYLFFSCKWLCCDNQYVGYSSIVWSE